LLKIGKFSKKLVDRNTNAYLQAMDKYNISTIAHLKYGNCYVDVKKIAEKAKEKHIYIELNGRRILFTPKEIQDMVDIGVKFIVDSDAHHPLDVGKNHRGINIIEKYNIPISQVANIDKLPDFTKATY
jgi:putative hydrolase